MIPDFSTDFKRLGADEFIANWRKKIHKLFTHGCNFLKENLQFAMWALVNNIKDSRGTTGQVGKYSKAYLRKPVVPELI